MSELKDAVALVTGASGGIGAAICRAFEAAGATVIATDVAARVPEGKNSLPSLNWYTLDVSSEDDWNNVVADVSDKWGRLDVLVNNAAVSPVLRLADMSLEDWRRCQSVNVDGVFLGIKAALPLLSKAGKLRRGGASVINMSSAGGIVGAPYNVAYCASKGAVRLLTKAAAIELSALGHSIRVNSVHPGCVRTEMMSGIINAYADIGGMGTVENATAIMNAAHPLGRMGEVDEIADAVLYLASDRSSFVHGSEFVVDGGYTSR